MDNKRRQSIYHTTNRTIEITHYDRLLDAHQWHIQIDKVCQKNMSSTDLAILSKSKFPEVREMVATHENADEGTLVALANDPVPGVVCAVAANEHSPTELLHSLAERDDKHLKISLAENANLADEALAVLFETNDNYLRDLVLRHHNCPENVLISASLGTDLRHRRLASEHLNLKDESTLERLSDDENFGIRIGVAKNTNLPGYLVAKLSSDPHEQVRGAIKIRKPKQL
jgi:hypothetical protein